MITLKNLSFRFPGFRRPLWSGVSLTVQPGERILLTGPSGCGKSTLLGVLAGLVPRLSYGIVDGKAFLNYRTPALVLQNPEAQIITPSVREEIAFALENRGWQVERIQTKVTELLDRLGLSPLAYRSPTTLSGGECQRLSLACALAQEPDILFLDEPTAYLDPEGASDFFRALEEIAPGVTLVMVEHRLKETSALVHRILELSPLGLTERPPRTQEVHSPITFRNDLLSRDLYPPGLFPSTLSVRNISHQYSGIPILFSNLCVDFPPGRIAAIMGPSGAGKSTFLKKLAGILGTHPGEIKVNGYPSGRRNARLINFIPQNPEHYFLRNTVAKEWTLTGKSQEGTASVAARFHLLDADDLHPCSLSEGEKRRLSLALAFLDPRPILILDEPTYCLDRRAFHQLTEDLKLLRSQGRTIVLATHSPDLVRECADDLYRLSGGFWEKSDGVSLNKEVISAL